MAIAPKLEFRQAQTLAVTPQLRQAIALLQMSNLELSQYLEGELESNPLLAREDDQLETFEQAEEKKEQETQGDNFEDYDAQFDDFGSDREGYGGDADASWQDYSPAKTKTAEDGFDYFQQRLAAGKSLQAFLDEQIAINFKTQVEKLIARRLCEDLDDAGYFRGNTAEIARKLKTCKAEVEKVLATLKTFEPSGIFAQSLRECLVIQLKDNNRYDPLIADLLNNLELVAQKKYKELTRLLNLAEGDLASMLSDIRALEPKPAAAYNARNDAANQPGQYIIPDVFLHIGKHGELKVELNQMSLPKVLIDKQYCAEINNKSKEASRYLKEQMNNASFLMKALHQRATSLLRVSEEIVRRQREFFLDGVDGLKPMNLRDVAQAAEMHESTVSRVTANKFIATPAGTFELKYFFSAAAATYTGSEDTSTLAIKSKIKKLIEAESPDNILSDDKLVEELARAGIKIARRTVAKYREALGLSASADRKRDKRNLAA